MAHCSYFPNYGRTGIRSKIGAFLCPAAKHFHAELSYEGLPSFASLVFRAKSAIKIIFFATYKISTPISRPSSTAIIDSLLVIITRRLMNIRFGPK